MTGALVTTTTVIVDPCANCQPIILPGGTIITPPGCPPFPFHTGCGPQPVTTTTTDYKIARMTPAGTFTLFAIPAKANDITAGPDGALWFTETGKMIGRITTTGAVSEFGPTQEEPAAITLGPDGAIWFTEGRSKIGRIDPTSHAIAEFPIAVPTGASLSDIAGAPDGGIWLGEDTSMLETPVNADRLVRFDPTTHTELVIALPPVPYPNTGPFSLTVGPDGALWFSTQEYSSNGIETDQAFMRLDLASHALSVYPIIDGVVAGIAPGPDGNMWSAQGSRIGQVVLGTQLVASPGAVGTNVGEAFVTPVAAFAASTSQVNGNFVPSLFAATVDWGDGTSPTAATIVPNGAGGFVAVAGHSYAQAGTYRFTTTVQLVGGLKATATGVATVLPMPVITGFAPLGFHAQPTNLVLSFNRPMDPARAQNVGNFVLLAPGRDGRLGTADDVRIPITSAVYVPAAATVVLSPFRPLPLRNMFQLVVNASPPTGLADTLGHPLNANPAGQFVQDSVISFRGFGTVAKGGQPKQIRPLRATLHRIVRA